VTGLSKARRPRWRYLGVGVRAWPDAAPDRRRLQAAVWDATTALFGDPGSAAVDPRVVAFDFADGAGEAVVRVHRGEVERARAALACVETVDGDPVALRVRGVSGTVRGCEERYLSGATGAGGERTVSLDGDRRPAVVRDDAVDVCLPDGFVGLARLDIPD
jgi:ribonuclease P/MRP protein subunit POP5